MNNEEVRFKLLKSLYDRYYDGKIEDYHSTQEIIEEIGFEKAELNSVDGNVDYLVKDGYVEGIRDNAPIPTFLKLEPYGIDFVEERSSELLEFHNKIRFQILAILHSLHFGGHIGKLMDSKSMARELVQFGETENEILGDIAYLEKKEYIYGISGLGNEYPIQVKIENAGIDVVDSIAAISVNELEKADLDSQTKKKVSEIKQADKKGKVEKLRELYDSNRKYAKGIIVETIKQAIIRGFQSGGDFGG